MIMEIWCTYSEVESPYEDMKVDRVRMDMVEQTVIQHGCVLLLFMIFAQYLFPLYVSSYSHLRVNYPSTKANRYKKLEMREREG